MEVRDIMTSTPVTVHWDTTITEVAELLDRNGFTAVPVIDDDGLMVGIVTEADLIQGRIRPDPRVHGPVAPPSHAPASSVHEVMTEVVESVTADADVADAAVVMTDRHIRSLPVVDDGRVIGILTRRDLLAAAVHSDDSIRTEIETLLTGSDDMGPSYRWQVTVQGGVADIADFQDRPDDRRRAKALAEHVRGVVSIQVRHQTSDPS